MPDTPPSPEPRPGTDATDAAALQAELARLRARQAVLEAQLQAARQGLESFAYAVSHDLRSPLRHIVGHIELFRNHVRIDDDPKADKYLATITDAGRRMGQMIDGLLAFSRLGRAPLTDSLVDCDALVAGARAALIDSTRDRAIAWEVTPLPRVRGDAQLLADVWVRLLENAVKFTRQQPLARIRVGAQPADGGATVFFVCDNGVGFSTAQAHKLFGVFQRLHHARDFEGIGMGLALAQRTIERHGGRMWADSTPGEGSCFYFSLPDTAAADAAA